MRTLTKLRLRGIAAATAVLGFGLSVAAQPLYPTSATYNVGTTQDGLGTGVPPGRDNPDNALGVPQNSDTNMGEVAGNSSTVNFVSLGFGGHIILGFDQPFGDGEGHDLEIYETSYNTPACGGWPERANVYVSQDGCNWVLVAEGQCQNFNVELPDNMPWGLYVKIEDASPNASFNWDADGYDVDGVKANYLSNVTLSGGPDIYPVEVINYNVGNLKGAGENNNNTPPANRKIASQAIGAPSTSDANGAMVFVSLGFDKPATAETEGTITLRFDYTVFDQAGPDLTVYETTWGDKITSSDCAKYPEIAEFWGSNTGNDGDWYLLNADPTNEPSEAYKGGPGRLCRDGKLDISSMPLSGGVRTLRYVKVLDKSIRSSNKFPNNADGYDVDGIVASTCGGGGGRLGYVDQVNVPDEEASIFFAAVYPNPAIDLINVNIETASVDQNYTVNIVDVTGRVVMSNSVNAAANSVVNVPITISELPSGVYVINTLANGYQSIQKVIKR